MAIHGNPSYIDFRDRDLGTRELNQDGKDRSNRFKEGIAFFLIALILFGILNPFQILYKRVRYSTIIAFYNVLIAPFGNTKFKAYILAEILTDCIIPLEDMGKLMTHIITGKWGANFAS